MTPSAMQILAMLPLGVFGLVAMRPPSPPIAPVPVQTEGITVRRMDADSFARRWPLELMSRRSEAGPRAWLGDVSPTRSEKDLLEVGSVRNAATGKPEAHEARHVVRLTTKRVQLDLCGRHKMRKVWVTSKRWRCRR